MQSYRFAAPRLTLALLASTCAVAAAPVAVAAPPAPAAAPLSQIIPLPLQPVVPADQRACTGRTASGLGYAVLRPSSAAAPGASDVALINYLGYLRVGGQVFDQAMRMALPVDGVVPGFGEGLRLMGRGAVYRLCIPAALGYGARGQGSIPANADLVFQVEMVDFKTAAEVEAIRAQQQQPPAEQPAK